MIQNTHCSYRPFALATLFLLTWSLTPVNAQAPIDAANLTPWVTGLQAPRGLAFGPDRQLYVAEAGTGGTTSTSTSCAQVVAPVGPYKGGPTARISRIDENGHRKTIASGLPSSADALGDLLGVADLVFLHDQLYALLQGGGCSHGNPKLPNGIVKVSTHSGQWNYVSNLSHFYAGHPGAYRDAADLEPDGAPYSMIAYDGDLISVESNQGRIVRTTQHGDCLLIDVSAHLGHIVPTAIAAVNGNLYVTNLGQFPITPDWEKLMTFSRDVVFSDPVPGVEENTGDQEGFRLAASRAGLSAGVSIKLGPDGLLYVLEFSTAAGQPTPGTGKVVRLTSSGHFEDVVTGLSVPTGMTFGPDNALYISNFGAAPAGAGQILRVFLP